MINIKDYEELKARIYQLEQELAYITSEANRLNREIEELKAQNQTLQSQLDRRQL